MVMQIRMKTALSLRVITVTLPARWSVENIICNPSAAQVVNFRARPFYFSLLFRPRHSIFPFDLFTFAVVPFDVYKRSYYYTETSLDCEGHCYILE